MLFIKDTSLLSRAAAAATLVLLALLMVVPCLVLFSAVIPGADPHQRRVLEVPLTCWAIWAMVSLWAGLDSSKLLRTIGRPADPLGFYGFWGMLLGMLNIAGSLLVVMLRTSR